MPNFSQHIEMTARMDNGSSYIFCTANSDSSITNAARLLHRESEINRIQLGYHIEPVSAWLVCDNCAGNGTINSGFYKRTTCKACKGKNYRIDVLSQVQEARWYDLSGHKMRDEITAIVEAQEQGRLAQIKEMKYNKSNAKEVV